MNILVGTDFSDSSRAAARWGAFLANQLGSDLTMSHVVDLASGDNAWRVLVETPDEIEQSALKEAQKSLREFLEDTVADIPDDVDYRAVLGNPIDELLEEAKTLDDPIIVAGTRGKSRLQEIFLGSTARRLVRRSEYPIILVPPESEVSTPERLVVGVDFSEPSREALRRAAMMARTYGATLDVVYGYVLPEVATFDGSMTNASETYEELVEDKRRSLERMVREEGVEDVVDQVSAVQSPPAQALIQTADERDAQFIFVGTHGRKGVKRFFLGNTAERVMRKSSRPVFVVRPGQTEHADSDDE